MRRWESGNVSRCEGGRGDEPDSRAPGGIEGEMSDGPFCVPLFRSEVSRYSEITERHHVTDSVRELKIPAAQVAGQRTACGRNRGRPAPETGALLTPSATPLNG